MVNSAICQKYGHVFKGYTSVFDGKTIRHFKICGCCNFMQEIRL